MPQPDRLDELLAQARQAQKLVGSVDLDRVARHDLEEVQRLEAAIISLSDLAGDEKARPRIDPEATRQQQLVIRLRGAGHGERIGCAYFGGSEYPIKPFSFAPHQRGLPPFDVCLAPDYTPVEGIHGIFISARGVYAAVVADPTADNDWKIVRSVPWESTSQVVEAVCQFIVRPERRPPR